MARYNGPVCRLCRREGMKLFLKGERCYTEKCAHREAQHAARPARPRRARRRWSATACSCARSRRSSASTACSKISSAATSSRPSGPRGITGETLLQLLERRLDNVVYRLGFATSRAQARQLVRHGHFLVNGKKVDIPSYSLKAGDVVSVRETSRENASILHAMEEVKGRGIPEWLNARREHGRQDHVDADARADQPAGAGTAHRRALLEVSQVGSRVSGITGADRFAGTAPACP